MNSLTTVKVVSQILYKILGENFQEAQKGIWELLAN